MLGFGRPIIDQYIIGSGEVVARQKNKSTGDRAKTFLVDSVDNLNAASGIGLEQSRRHFLDILQFLNFVADLDGHRSGAEPEEIRGIFRLKHDVGANALDALGGFGKNSRSEADD